MANTTVTENTFDIDYYRISSPSGQLDFNQWNSLDDQNYDAGGPGVGESWDEAGGSNDEVLAEAYLLGSSEFEPNERVSLGKIFRVGGVNDLTFEYRDAVSGNVFTGMIAAVLNGDYDDDGLVGAGDLSLVLTNWGEDASQTGVPDGWINMQPTGLIGAEQLSGVLQNWGNTAPVAAVPEPMSLCACWWLLVGIMALRRRF